MMWLLTRVVVWPVKASTGSLKLGYRTGRMFGYRRIFVFGLGVAVGLLLAPVTGAELRRRIQELIDGDASSDVALAPWSARDDKVVDLTMETAP